MSKNNKAIVILIVIAVVFTAFAFLVPFPRTPGFFIAYIAELVALALQIPIFKVAFDGKDTPNSKVLGFPLFRVGYYYLGIQTALSLLIFVLGFVSFPTWLAALLCIIVLGGAVACSMAADIAREQVEKIEYSQKADTSLMDSLRTRSAALVGRASDPQLKKCLEKLAEDIRFSDPVSSSAIVIEEQTLMIAFDKLEAAVASNDESAVQECSKVQEALEVRNAACKSGKNYG